MLEKELTRQQFEARLFLHATKDESFRQQLLQSPKQAIEEEFGETIGEHFQIIVHEENADTVHFVIPWNPFSANSDEDLSGEDLDRVTGGVMECSGVALSTVACTGR